MSAFLLSGTLNTLIDEPRFLFLLLVLAGLACNAAAVGNSFAVARSNRARV
jgi:hypothetical protein